MVNQQLKFKIAIEKFIDSVRNADDIIGILITGSYVRLEIDENSDVDIHLVLEPNCNYRERGNRWVGGVEIEYFKNPPQQIRSYFEQEIDSPHTASMFADARVEYKSSVVIDELIEEAKQIISHLPPKPNDLTKELSKYFLDDLFKDLKDCQVNRNEIDFRFVKIELIDRCIDIMCSLRQFRRAKEKKLFAQIRQKDQSFAGLLLSALKENDLQLKETKVLVEYVEALLGGKRSKEWTLRSGLDLVAE